MAIPPIETPPLAIESARPMVSPAVPPWVVGVRIFLQDDDPARLDADGRRRVQEQLSRVTEEWKLNSEEYARARRVTESLADVEARIEKATADARTLDAQLAEALMNGRDVGMLDAQLADLGVEKAFLAERRAKIGELAGKTKDQAEQELRKTIKAAAVKLKAELLKELAEAQNRLAGNAYGPACNAIAAQVAADVCDPRNVDDFFVPDLLAPLAPDGLARDRAIMKVMRDGAARQPAPKPGPPPGIG